MRARGARARHYDSVLHSYYFVQVLLLLLLRVLRFSAQLTGESYYMTS